MERSTTAVVRLTIWSNSHSWMNADCASSEVSTAPHDLIVRIHRHGWVSSVVGEVNIKAGPDVLPKQRGTLTGSCGHFRRR